MAYSAVAIVSIVTIITNIAFVGLRTWARVLLWTKWMWADFLVPLSLTVNVLQSALFIYLWNAYESRGEKGPLVFRAFVFPFLNGIAITVPKLAVIDAYLQIFQRGWAKWTLRITAAVLIASGLAVLFGTIFQCRPIRFSWDHSIQGQCSDLKALFNYLFIPNVVTDVVLLVVPLPIIAGLHLSWSVKAGVLATFFSGAIGVVAASIRLYIFFQWTPRKGDADRIRIASNLEISAYLTVACLLHMKPLINRLRQGPKVVSDYTSRYYRNANSDPQSTDLTALDRRTSRRLPSTSGDSAREDFIHTDAERGLGTYAYSESEMNVRYNSSAASSRTSSGFGVPIAGNSPPDQTSIR